MRCKHTWIYEGVTHIECAEPGCKNFDPKMHQYSMAFLDSKKGRTMGWGIVWHLLDNVVRRNTHFIPVEIYSTRNIQVLALDRDMFEMMCREHDLGVEDIFTSRKVDWSEEERQLIHGYVIKAVEIGTKKLNQETS